MGKNRKFTSQFNIGIIAGTDNISSGKLECTKKAVPNG